MAANGYAEKGRSYSPGHWGKWKGVTCVIDGCDRPAKCKKMCMSHYGALRRAVGDLPPSYNDPVARRKIHLRARYGLEVEEYDRILQQQGGVCAICKRPPPEIDSSAPRKGKPKKHLCVDHCHDTSVIRGLLCDDCNIAIGRIRTPEQLRIAADYVENNGG